MRAFRCDKMTLAALEATLRIYLNEEKALREIPVLQLLSLPLEELEKRAEVLGHRLRALGTLETVEPAQDVAYVGGGSLPDQKMATWVVELKPRGVSDADPQRLALHAGRDGARARRQDRSRCADGVAASSRCAGGRWCRRAADGPVVRYALCDERETGALSIGANTLATRDSPVAHRTDPIRRIIDDSGSWPPSLCSPRVISWAKFLATCWQRSSPARSSVRPGIGPICGSTGGDDRRGGNAYGVYREDLEEGLSVKDALVGHFGAALDDEIVEIQFGAALHAFVPKLQLANEREGHGKGEKRRDAGQRLQGPRPAPRDTSRRNCYPPTTATPWRLHAPEKLISYTSPFIPPPTKNVGHAVWISPPLWARKLRTLRFERTRPIILQQARKRTVRQNLVVGLIKRGQ